MDAKTDLATSLSSWTDALGDLVSSCNAFVRESQARTPPDARLLTLLAEALEVAEAFMAGFEGDELQEGIDLKLAQIRYALARAKPRDAQRMRRPYGDGDTWIWCRCGASAREFCSNSARP